jgi:hypothetical protein
MTQLITATTFQLTHVNTVPFKCTFDIGDEVNSPCGKGVIIKLNKETGDCELFLEKTIK